MRQSRVVVARCWSIQSIAYQVIAPRASYPGTAWDSLLGSQDADCPSSGKRMRSVMHGVSSVVSEFRRWHDWKFALLEIGVTASCATTDVLAYVVA